MWDKRGNVMGHKASPNRVHSRCFKLQHPSVTTNMPKWQGIMSRIRTHSKVCRNCCARSEQVKCVAREKLVDTCTWMHLAAWSIILAVQALWAEASNFPCELAMSLSQVPLTIEVWKACYVSYMLSIRPHGMWAAAGMFASVVAAGYILFISIASQQSKLFFLDVWGTFYVYDP